MNFYIGIIIFIFTFYLIVSEKIPGVWAALLGGLAMRFCFIISQDDMIRAVGDNLDIVFLLIGMMIIVHIIAETGLFQWVAIKLAQFVRGEPIPLLMILVLITALFSAFLDNVTTILLIAPVSIVLAEQLEIDAVPFLIAEAMASNIGGTATLIGDPPNILIASKANLTFNDFIFHLTPVIIINLIVFLITIWIFFRKKMKVKNEMKVRVMELDATRTLKDKKLMIQSCSIMLIVLIGFFTHSTFHIEPSAIAFGGALILSIIAKKDPEEIFKTVEWKTLFFFIGLFILVEGVVKIGAIEMVAQWAIKLTNGSLKLTAMLILWLSAICSSIVDNIPYTATMIPIIGGETGLINNISNIMGNTPEIHSTVRYALWWSLSLGACLGGNGTLVGASANVVAAGIAAKSGRSISFMKFTKYGLFIMFQSMIICSIYIWFRYLI